MPFLVTILLAIGGAIWWWIRRNPHEALDMAQDAAVTIRNAPRRFAFRKQTNMHAVDKIDDEHTLICAIAQAFIELDDLPTAEQRDQLVSLLSTKLHYSPKEAAEMAIFGRWVITQCQSPANAVPRLGRRLYKIAGPTPWEVLQDILMAIVGDDLSRAQIDAVSDLRVAFKR